MKHGSFLILLLSLFILQTSRAEASHNNLVCESRGGYHFCNAPIRYRSDVQFVQKISKASCNEGYSWGVTRGGIWVDRGCRAEFAVSRGGGQISYRPSEYPGYHNHNNCTEHDHGNHGTWWGNFGNAIPKPHGHGGYHKIASCPAGAQPGRCTPKQRQRGCKDFRTPAGVGCMSYR